MAKYTRTKVTRQGYGNRLGESIKGVLIGGALVLIAFPVLFWNEGRAVQTAKSLDEGSAAVQTVSAETLDAEKEDSLVHMTGEATTVDTLNDQTFGITEEGAIRLVRVVEMYQWKETEKTETQRNTGGSETRITTYEYTETWSESHIDSNSFDDPHSFQNPSSLPFQRAEQVASKVTVGPFTLGERLVGQIRGAEPRPFTDADMETLPAQARERADGRSLSIREGVLYGAYDPNSPMVGDFRVRFEIIRPLTVSIVAKQLGSDLVPYQTQAGDALAMLQTGVHDSATMFAAAMAANTMMTWILRLVGFFMFFLGFGLIFKPLAVAADVLPFLGNVLRMGTGLVAGVLAFSLTLITVAIGWIVYRPVAGILLLIVGVGAIVGIKFLASKKKAEAPAAEPPVEAEQPAA